MSKIVFTWFILMLAFSVTGCNTVSNVGQDLEDSGKLLQDTSKDGKQLINDAEADVGQLDQDIKKTQ